MIALIQTWGAPAAPSLPTSTTTLTAPPGLGRGAALKRALGEALQLGVERVLTLPVHGALSSPQAMALLDALEHAEAAARGEHGVDVVLGLPQGSPPLFERAFAKLANRRLHATLSMYHGVTVAYRADALRGVHLDRLPDDHGFERALLLSLLARGFRASEARIPLPLHASPLARGASAALDAALHLSWPRA